MSAPSSDAMLERFGAAADAAQRALLPLVGEARRARTERPGQYALDLVADDAVVPLLLDTEIAVLSEESGLTGAPDAPITVVLDPVDGSTNCARGIPYWSISLCAIDASGPLCALVANQATGERFTAIRGGGAWCDGVSIAPSKVVAIEEAVVALAGMPRRLLPWKQFRALGSAALTLCDVAAGKIDGYVDALADMHAPWDYLGGMLVCEEARAHVSDLLERPLVTRDPDARRTLVAASTPELADVIRTAAGG